MFSRSMRAACGATSAATNSRANAISSSRSCLDLSSLFTLIGLNVSFLCSPASALLQLHRYFPRVFEQQRNELFELLRQVPERQGSDTHGCHRPSPGVHDRHTDGTDPLLQLLIVDGVPSLSAQSQLLAQPVRICDRTGGKPFQAKPVYELLLLLRWKESQKRLPEGRAVQPSMALPRVAHD